MNHVWKPCFSKSSKGADLKSLPCWPDLPDGAVSTSTLSEAPRHVQAPISAIPVSKLKLQADVKNLHQQRTTGDIDDMQYRLQALIIFYFSPKNLLISVSNDTCFHPEIPDGNNKFRATMFGRHWLPSSVSAHQRLLFAPDTSGTCQWPYLRTGPEPARN